MSLAGRNKFPLFIWLILSSFIISISSYLLFRTINNGQKDIDVIIAITSIIIMSSASLLFNLFFLSSIIRGDNQDESLNDSIQSYQSLPLHYDQMKDRTGSTLCCF